MPKVIYTRRTACNTWTCSNQIIIQRNSTLYKRMRNSWKLKITFTSTLAYVTKAITQLVFFNGGSKSCIDKKDNNKHT